MGGVFDFSFIPVCMFDCMLSSSLMYEVYRPLPPFKLFLSVSVAVFPPSPAKNTISF